MSLTSTIKFRQITSVTQANLPKFFASFRTSFSLISRKLNFGVKMESSLDPNIYKLSEKVAGLKYSDLLPLGENSQEATREFLQKIVDLLIDYIELCFNRDEPVLDFHQPDCLKKKIDMEIGAEGVPLNQLIEDCAMALKHQVKSGHPRFLNQLSTGLDIISMAGEWLTATANSNTFTFEVSPVFNSMEAVVLEKMRGIIGFTGGDSVFAPGLFFSKFSYFNSSNFLTFDG